ncbi:MAG: hypothetical protein AAF802_15360 [Planctomycetota bacterium]
MSKRKKKKKKRSEKKKAASDASTSSSVWEGSKVTKYPSADVRPGEIEDLVFGLVVEGSKPYEIVLAAVRIQFFERSRSATREFGRLFIEWISRQGEFCVYPKNGEVHVGLADELGLPVTESEVFETEGAFSLETMERASSLEMPRSQTLESAASPCNPAESADDVATRVIQRLMQFNVPLPVRTARINVQADFCFVQKGETWVRVLRRLLLAGIFRRVEHGGVVCLV